MRTSVLVAVALALWAPAAAHAANVSVSTDFVHYQAAAGEANRLSVAYGSDLRTVTVTDPGAPVSAGEGCTSTGPNSATCTAPDGPDQSLTTTLAELGDRDDTLDVTTAPDSVIGAVAGEGGTGDDVLSGGGANDGLIGGGGTDELLGGGGGDTLSDGDLDCAGVSPDRAPDGDTFDGGDGIDEASYVDRVLEVRAGLREGSAEGDVFRDVENLTGGSGDDRLAGDGAGNILRGGPGEDELAGRGNPFGTEADVDRLFGGPDSDILLGGRGEDHLAGQRGFDELSCGSARDAVIYPDPGELLPRTCEAADASFGVSGETSFIFRPHPIRVRPRFLVFDIGCPVNLVGDPDEFVPCSATLTIRGALGRRQLLGRGSYEMRRRSDSTLVRVRLTRLGRRLAGRRRGVVGEISVRGEVFDGFPSAIGWAIPFRIR